MFDVFEVVPGQLQSTRVRYVVVDVRDGSLVSRDFDPLDGNLANPAFREASRSR
jgi:hypothetical protein